MHQQIVFPNGQTLNLAPETVAGIAVSSARYSAPLWFYRAERVLKLGGHQWIEPAGPSLAQAAWQEQPAGCVATAWKLFNRGWAGAAEEYFYDSQRYPHHPRHYGPGVIPLVDEDNDSQQIGWVRVLQQTAADENHAVFVQFVLLEMFDARALPAAYG